MDHLHDHHRLYDGIAGVRTARKHIGWAVKHLPGGEAFRTHMNTLEAPEAQLRAVGDFFDALADAYPVLP
jgi:tRNA-dihydrouridine synthase B